MKNKKLVGSLIIILMFFGTITNSTTLNLNNSPKTSQEELINIDFTIYINGNWSETADLYDWCYGSGTEEDPWVIEGIHVTNENKTAHISIETVEYFIIRNVMVSEYARPYGHYSFAGIFIDKGEYGLIENCTFVNCSNGISLHEAKDDIRITNNTFIGSHNDPITGMGKAILIHEAKGVVIDYNDIYNYYDGIVVRNAEEIHIENNRIETSFGHISDTGIYFMTVNDSSIINNDFYGCKFDGHEYNVTLSGNTALRTSFIGNCHNLTIHGNKYYDLDGNLITDIDELNYWIFIVLGGVIIVIIIGLIIIFKKRKSSKI